MKKVIRNIMFMPNYLFGLNIAHFTSVLPLLHGRVYKPKYNMPTLVFMAYISYILLRNVLYFYFDHTDFRLTDISEFKRALVLIGAFYVAKPYGEEKLEKDRLYLLSFVVLIGLHFTNLNIYGSHIHRFSAHMASVNYIWLPLALLLVYGKTFYKNVDIYLLVLVSIFLSSSLTSTFVILNVTAIYIFYEYREQLSSNLFSILVVGGIVALALAQGLLLEFQFKKFMTAYEAAKNLDLTMISSFAKRVDVWEKALGFIWERPWFGHGVNKDLLLYTDNSYLMTLFRYGIVGFILEWILVGFLAWHAWKRQYLFAMLLFVGLIISSIPANTMYEIKTIPVIGLVMGQLFK